MKKFIPILTFLGAFLLLGGVSFLILFKPFQTSQMPQKTLTQRMASSTISKDDVVASEQDEDSKNIPFMRQKRLQYILSDKDKRISDEFTIPETLKKRVEFWFKVYSLYTISHAILHDNEHPWIIYEIVNLNSVYNKTRTRTERDMTKSQMIRNARYKYQSILGNLSKRSFYLGLSNEEQRVFNLFKDIPGPRKQVFLRAKQLIRVQLGQKDSVLYAIKRSGRYLKSMEVIFKKEGLPLELTRIPFLESSFNLNAYSKDGASGIWQFMSKTGKIFLTISNAQGIDERNHPLKATEAAANLLKQNYQIFRQWPLAITAYNHGPGGLLKGIKKVGSRNLSELIKKYKDAYFGFASKNFFSSFLAMLYTEHYQDLIFGHIERDDHLVHADIEIKYSMRIKFIMDLCGLSKEEIKLYNPDLRKKALNSHSYLPDGYYLKLPKGKEKHLFDFYKEVEETNKILDQLLGKEI